MTEELSPADRSAVAAERGPVNMAVGGVLVFEAEPPLTRALVAERLAQRIHLIPRLRQRLQEPALDPDPRRAAAEFRRTTELALELARTRPSAPMTPLNHAISPNRRFALATGELAAVKRAGRAAGATVNDALLGVVAGMLRRYLD